MASSASASSTAKKVSVVEPKVVCTSTDSAVLAFKTTVPDGEGKPSWSEGTADVAAFCLEQREANMTDFGTPWTAAQVLSQEEAPRALATQLWQANTIPSLIARGEMTTVPGVAVPPSRQIKEGSFCVVLSGLRENCTYLVRARPLSAAEHEALLAAYRSRLEDTGGVFKRLPPAKTAPSAVAAEKAVTFTSELGPELSITTAATPVAARDALEAVASAQLSEEARSEGTAKRRRRLAATNATAYLLGKAQLSAAAGAGGDMVVVRAAEATRVESDSVVVKVRLEAASDAASASAGRPPAPALGGFAVSWCHDSWAARTAGLVVSGWAPAEADDDEGAILPATGATSGTVPGKFRVMTSKKSAREFEICIQGLPPASPVALRVWPLSEEEASSAEPVESPSWPAPTTVHVTTAAAKA